MTAGQTEYSEKFPGSRANYGWPVRFDLTDGYVGIDQYDEEGKFKERVLLSPAQVRALIDFVGVYSRVKAGSR